MTRQRDAALGAQLGRYLSEATKVPTSVAFIPTYAELLEQLMAGSLDLAWLPPVLVVRACAGNEVTLLVGSRREAGQRYRSALFVRESSTIRSSDDLHGKTIAWVDPDSASGHVFARDALERRGLGLDIFAQGLFLGSHAAVVEAVASGRVDVGASYCSIDPDGAVVNTGWGDAPMRVVLLSADIPADAVCIADRVDATTRDRIAEALTELHRTEEGREVLRDFFHCARFEPTLPHYYESVRRISATTIEPPEDAG